MRSLQLTSNITHTPRINKAGSQRVSLFCCPYFCKLKHPARLAKPIFAFMLNPRHASIEVDGAKAGDYAAREVRAYFAGGEKSYKPTLQQDLKELTPKERVNAMLKLLEFVVPKAAQKTEITNKTTVVAFEGRLRELIDREKDNIDNALKAARKAARDAAAEEIIIPSGDEDTESDNEIAQEYGDTTDNQET